MSKSKTMFRVLCVVLSLVMALSVGQIKTQAEEKASKYLSSSTFDVNKAMVGLTEAQFNRKMEQDTPATAEKTQKGEFDFDNNLTFSENGCLTYKVYIASSDPSSYYDHYATCWVGMYTDNAETKQYAKDNADTLHYVQKSIPVDGDSTVFLKCNNALYQGGSGSIYVWLNFVPMSQMIKMDYCEENDDGSYTFYVKNVADNIDHSSVCAFVGDITAREAYLAKETSEIFSIPTDNGAKIKLPKKGTYTLLTTVFTDDNSQMEFVQVVKTADYAKKSAKTLGKPIAAYAGTKVVIGKADPGATVSCTFNKNTKTTTADDSGLYIIELDKALKAKDKIVLWQKVGKMTGKKKTFKISK